MATASNMDIIHRIMNTPENIRHVLLVGGEQHGKSTLKDTLVRSRSVRIIEGKKESDDTIMHYPTTTLVFPSPSNKNDSENNDYLINVADVNNSRGIMDAHITTMLHVMDGAVIVLDGSHMYHKVDTHTTKLLEQTMLAQVKPVVVLTQLDHALMGDQVDLKAIYQSFAERIRQLNHIVHTFKDASMEETMELSPTIGNIVFASGLHQWGFTLERFGQIYAARFGVDEQEMTEKLWGDWFFDEATNEWVNKNNEAGTLKHGFCRFVLDPIVKLFNAIRNGNTAEYEKMISTFDIELDVDEQVLSGDALFHRTMQRWLPCSDAVLKMIVEHVPSPISAQKYRVDTLYDGPLDDQCANAIRTCDINGPLVMYVSNLVPTISEKYQFYAFGRVFGGKITTGQQVRLLGPGYQPGMKKDEWRAAVECAFMMVSEYHAEVMTEIPAGNICCLAGVDQYFVKSGTITTSETAYSMHAMKHSVLPMIRVTVEPTISTDLPKLVNAMKHLAKSDPVVLTYTDEYGARIIAGANERHVEACVKQLDSCSFQVSTPFVSYRETISKESSQICIAKSPNRHNRLFCAASPLGDVLTAEIESGRRKELLHSYNRKLRAQYLIDNHGWEESEAQHIWAYGPEANDPNVLVDLTRYGSILNDIKESVILGFHWATSEGVLCEEPLRGVRINLLDVTLTNSSRPNVRSRGQLIPATRRVVYASQLTASPVLMEPVFAIHVEGEFHSTQDPYSEILLQREAIITQNFSHGASDWIGLNALIPLRKSLGLARELEAVSTNKSVQVHWSFSHYDHVPGDPCDVESIAGNIVADVRLRKALKPEIPSLDLFLDKF